jgi:hypothetical protein
MKYSFPRSDLRVTANGVQIKPAFALGGWIAFKAIAGLAMMMGDLVLTEEEIGPVMRALQQNGVGQTALHNHGAHGIVRTPNANRMMNHDPGPWSFSVVSVPVMDVRVMWVRVHHSLVPVRM